MARRSPGVAGLAALPFDALADPRKAFTIVEDFVGGGDASEEIGTHSWLLTGAGGSVAYSGEKDHPGILAITVATTDFAANVALNADTIFLGSEPVYLAAQFRIPDSLTNQVVRFGLTDATVVTGGRGSIHATVEYDQATDADDFVVVVDDNSTETVETAIASAPTPTVDTWHTVEMAVSSGDVMAWVDGQPLLDDVVTASPIAETTGLTPYFQVGDGSNGENVDLDFIVVRQRVARAGFTAE